MKQGILPNLMSLKSLKFLNSFLGCLTLMGIVIFEVSTLSAQTSQPYIANGNYVVPANVQLLTAQCWGGGGAGGTRTNNGNGGSGGGGAFACSTFTVIPGTSFPVIVGTSGTNGVNGGSSIFGTNIVVATGGLSAPQNSNSGANGGQASTSVGFIKYSGGNGANSASNTGAAGGGAGGPATNGGNATSSNFGLGGGLNAGRGGDAQTSGNGNGNAGVNYGGGGGGARRTSGSTRNGGIGGSGYVVVSPTIWANPITGTNPSAINPFTAGSISHPNVSVSGITRSSGISASSAADRFSANNFSTDDDVVNDKFFEFSITPSLGSQLNFNSLFITFQRSSTGPREFNIRSSLDGFTTSFVEEEELNDEISSFNIPLTAATFQNIASTITFRVYPTDADNISGTFSINDFFFFGNVNAAPVISSFSPVEVCNTGSQQIVITGLNFTGATSVTIDGAAASFVVNSNTQITATVPATATSGLITVTTPSGVANSDFFAKNFNFEGTGETKTDYAPGNVVLSGINWNLTEVLIGTLSADYRNGSRSARFHGFSNSAMTMLEDKANGIGKISFKYRAWGTDPQVVWRVEYSTNAGISWTQVGSNFTATSTVQFFNETLNIPGNARIRILHVSGGNLSTDRRMNIDDIVLSDHNTTAVLSILSPATQPGAFTTSSSSVCPGASGVVYTVPNVPNVTYNWSYSGTGVTFSGSGNSITANFNPTASNGVISVVAVNSCGASAARSIAVTMNPAPVASITPTYCLPNGKVRLTATSSNFYLWSTGEVNNPIEVDQAGEYTVTITNATGCSSSATFNLATELVSNGSFTAGNTGFTTAYTFVADGPGQNELISEGTYSIVNDANLVHPSFYGKQRNGTAGNIMVINGHPSLGSAVWNQNSITVQPNTTYYFSAWAMSVVNGNNAVLRFTINGNQVGNTAFLPNGYTSIDGPYNWVRFFGTWNSGSETTANLSIINLNTVLGGNDFALDDISFGTLAPIGLTVSPTANVGGSVCAGQALTLQSNMAGGASPFTYAWSGPNGFTSSLVNPSVSSNATSTLTGTYNLIVTDALGCTASNSVILTINPAPLDRTLSAAATAICAGASTNIDVPLSETGVLYQLKNVLNDDDIGIPQSGTGATISLPTGNLDISTTFYVIATRASTGCSFRLTNEPVVTVNPTPELNITNQAACSGTINLTLPAVTAGSTGSGTLSYWTSAAATTALANPVAVSSGTYFIRLTTTAGCSDIEPVVVIVSNAPVSTFNYSGSPFCSSATNPLPTYSGGGVAGVFSSTAGLVFVDSNTGEINLSASTPGTYSVVNTITPVGGCPVSTTSRSITITARPSATFSYEGNSFCQSINAINPAPVYSNGGQAGTFTSSSGLLSLNSTSGVINLSASLPGNYLVINTRSAVGGCSAVSDTAYININPYTFEGAISTSVSNDVVCQGEPITLFASGTPYLSILLSENFNGTINNWIRTNASTGGTTANAAWTLRPEGYNVNTTYSSNDDSQFYLSDSRTQNGTITSTILRSPIMSTVGYSTLQLNFWHYYDFDNRPSESARVQVSTNGVTWTTLATYTSDQGSASNFANVSINLNSYIGFPVFYVRFNYYAGARARYWAIDNVTISGQTTNYNFSWASIPAGFVSNLQTPTFSPNNNASYIVTSQNTYGCETSNSPVPVTVKPLPQLSSTLTPPAICSGSNFTYSPTSNQVGATFTWTRPATPGITNSAITSAQTTNPSEILDNATASTVPVSYSYQTTLNGCTRSEVVVVQVNPKPVVTISSDAVTCNGTGSQLTSNVSNAVGAVSYAWSPAATLNNASISNPVATPLGASESYTLTVTNANNCSATSTSSTITNFGFGGTPGLWTGAQNNNWNNCQNWSDGRVPNSTTDVLMNESALNDITISGLATCKSLTLLKQTGTNDIEIELLPNSELQVVNDIFISNTSPTASVNFEMKPNSSLQCLNLSISGSSAGAQNAIFESNGTNNTITINGNLVISTGGKLDLNDGNNTTNDATLILKGNLINNGSIADADLGNSKIVVNGSSSQTINCPSNSSFCDLVINNSSNTPILLNNNIRIERLLNLQNGKLDLNGRVLRLGTSTMPATITGGNANSYIISWDGADNGSIIHNVPSNTASYLFPMGDLNHYTPFEVILNQGTLSNATLTAKLNPTAHLNLGVASNFLNRYWTIEQTGIANPLYDVVYGYAPSDVVGTDAFIFPAKFNAGGWQSSNESGANAVIGNGDVNTASRIITWSGITTFSDFTGVGSGTALPIELLSFTAEPEDNHVSLNWITASESNNSHFIIERSRNTITIEEIARVEGAGYSNVIRNYQTLDKKPLDGISYYRLKQIDFDGKYSYSEWTPVNFSQNEYIDIDYVNYETNSGKLFVKCINPDNIKVEFSLLSSNGQLISSLNSSQLSSDWLGYISTPNPSSGTYFLLMRHENKTVYKKFVVH